MNILPIPGLDGGHAIFTLWEDQFELFPVVGDHAARAPDAGGDRLPEGVLLRAQAVVVAGYRDADLAVGVIRRTGSVIANYWEQLKLIVQPKTQMYEELGGFIATTYCAASRKRSLGLRPVIISHSVKIAWPPSSPGMGRMPNNQDPAPNFSAVLRPFKAAERVAVCNPY